MLVPLSSWLSNWLRRRWSRATAWGLEGLKRVKSFSCTFLPSLEMDFCNTGGKRPSTPDSKEMPLRNTILAVPTEQPDLPDSGGSHQMLSMSAIWISYCRPRVLFMMASATLQTMSPKSGFRASLRMAAPAAFMMPGDASRSNLRQCGCCVAWCGVVAINPCCSRLATSAEAVRVLLSDSSSGTRASGTSATSGSRPAPEVDTAPSTGLGQLDAFACDLGCFTSSASTTSVMGERRPTLKWCSNCSKASCSKVSRRLPWRCMS
mmetsp:Transcript_68732/g.222065  ORF Transcript_68732/g.222065 Transcript_68732/m.222065 type:complete len:263 (+) Transcript_68732:787-1575(+)